MNPNIGNDNCPTCSHPPHIGACSRRMGGTAYGCGCLRDTPTPPAPAHDAVRAMPTRGDVGRPEATRDPVFLLRYRIKGDRPDKNRWHVDSVWFTREEAEAFGNNHAHRWGTDLYGPRWQVYCVPANGDLAALLKAVTKRDALAAERAQGEKGGDRG